MRHKLQILFGAVSAVMLCACNVTRKLPESKYLLTKNTIRIEYPDTLPKMERVSPSELERFIPTTQTPNKKIFGAPFFLWVYNLSDTAKSTWFQRTLRRIGEEPILLDSTLTQRSVRDMRLFMNAKGFYDASVSDSVVLKKKKAEVDYSVVAGIPYKISDISYRFQDRSLRNAVLSDTASSLLRVGQLLDRTKMEEERTRIAQNLENLGYYQFSVNNIRYIVDTLQQDYTASVVVNILQNNVANNLENNKIFRIRNIYINSDYDPVAAAADTIAYDTVQYNGFHYIYRKGVKPNIRPEVLTRAIGIYPNYIYTKTAIDATSYNISNLKYFKNVNILFSETDSEEENYVTFIGNDSDSLDVTQEGYLDCTILCTPVLKQGYKIEAEASTNANYTGLSLTLGYSNKNIFKGADIFDISLKTAYDFVRAAGKKNSYEIGVSASLTFPRFMVPFKLDRYKKIYNVNSQISLSYNRQQRPDYNRTLSSVAFGYNWSNGKYLSYVFRPINLSLIKVPWISQDYWNSIQNPYLRNSYESQLILGMFGSFNYTTQNTPRIKTISVRVNTETSGNFLNLVSVIRSKARTYRNDENYYKIFGIRYAQYVRSEVNVSFRYKFSEKAALVYRFYAGGGYAYGNTKSMPFERMFFAGGSSSMRGWQVRTLGPGATPEQDDARYPNQVGDLKLETNLEARFPIAGPLRGAVFFDVGNIWSNGKGETNPEARFKFNTFYKQLGFNTGAGLRFDFNYFVLRLDWGIQLHNPGWPAGKRWIQNFKLKNTALHFGIGYPF